MLMVQGQCDLCPATQVSGNLFLTWGRLLRVTGTGQHAASLLSHSPGHPHSHTNSSGYK